MFLVSQVRLDFMGRVSPVQKKVYEVCSKILIVPKEGWFGQPNYSTPSKKTFSVVPVSAFEFLILYVKLIKSPLLIQRIPEGSSFGYLLSLIFRIYLVVKCYF